MPKHINVVRYFIFTRLLTMLGYLVLKFLVVGDRIIAPY